MHVSLLRFYSIALHSFWLTACLSIQINNFFHFLFTKINCKVHLVKCLNIRTFSFCHFQLAICQSFGQALSKNNVCLYKDMIWIIQKNYCTWLFPVFLLFICPFSIRYASIIIPIIMETEKLYALIYKKITNKITNIKTVILVRFPYIRSSSESSLLFGVSIGAAHIMYIAEKSVITASGIMNASKSSDIFIVKIPQRSITTESTTHFFLDSEW